MFSPYTTQAVLGPGKRVTIEVPEADEGDLLVITVQPQPDYRSVLQSLAGHTPLQPENTWSRDVIYNEL